MKLVSLASLVVVAAACGGKPAPSAPIANTGSSQPLVAAGDDGMIDGALWTCQISDYDPQPCKLAQTPDGWTLTKLLGSQRFRGAIDFDGGDRARFVGEFFCPWGDCTQAMEVDFVREGGAYTTAFSNDTVSVRYDAALASEWGGAGYGGLTGDEQ